MSEPIVPYRLTIYDFLQRPGRWDRRNRCDDDPHGHPQAFAPIIPIRWSRHWLAPGKVSNRGAARHSRRDVSESKS